MSLAFSSFCFQIRMAQTQGLPKTLYSSAGKECRALWMQSPVQVINTMVWIESFYIARMGKRSPKPCSMKQARPPPQRCHQGQRHMPNAALLCTGYLPGGQQWSQTYPMEKASSLAHLPYYANTASWLPVLKVACSKGASAYPCL